MRWFLLGLIWALMKVQKPLTTTTSERWTGWSHFYSYQNLVVPESGTGLNVSGFHSKGKWHACHCATAFGGLLHFAISCPPFPSRKVFVYYNERLQDWLLPRWLRSHDPSLEDHLFGHLFWWNGSPSFFPIRLCLLDALSCESAPSFVASEISVG